MQFLHAIDANGEFLNSLTFNAWHKRRTNMHDSFFFFCRCTLLVFGVIYCCLSTCHILKCEWIRTESNRMYIDLLMKKRAFWSVKQTYKWKDINDSAHSIMLDAKKTTIKWNYGENWLNILLTLWFNIHRKR